jgi:hypothetical protein
MDVGSSITPVNITAMRAKIPPDHTTQAKFDVLVRRDIGCKIPALMARICIDASIAIPTCGHNAYGEDNHQPKRNTSTGDLAKLVFPRAHQVKLTTATRLL